MNSNNPQRSADEPIMRPVEELEGEDTTKQHGANRDPVQTTDGDAANVAVAQFQAGAQVLATPIVSKDMRDALEDGPEERREEDV